MLAFFAACSGRVLHGRAIRWEKLHLVDPLFAGSAMWTTEGVWMSVTPTKEALIVALDFEGKSFAEFVLSNPFS
jgi:hypothetical protein